LNRELDVVMKRLTSDHSPTTKLTRLPKRDDLLFRVRVLWLLHDGRPMRARELVVQRVHLGSGAREKRPLSAPQKKPATKWKEPIKSEPKVRACSWDRPCPRSTIMAEEVSMPTRMPEYERSRKGQRRSPVRSEICHPGARERHGRKDDHAECELELAARRLNRITTGR